MSNQQSVYQALTEAGCKTDSHESDLYVEATDKAREILSNSGAGFSRFRSKVDGKDWFDVPFMFDPFWECKPF